MKLGLQLGVFIVQFVLLASVILYKPSLFEEWDKDYTEYLTYVFIFSFALNLIQRKKDENWFRIDILFPFAFFIVSFQAVYFTPFLNVIPSQYENALHLTQRINYAVWLCAIGGISWFIGVSLCRILPKTKGQQKKVTFHIEWLNKVLIGLVIVFFTSVGKDFFSLGNYAGALNWSTSSRYLFPILNIFFILSLFSNFFVSRGSTISQFFKSNLFYLSVFFFYNLILLATGERGMPIMLGIVFLVLLSEIFVRLNFVKFISIIFVGALIMVIVGIGRKSGETNPFKGGVSNFVEERQENFLWTDELATIFRTVTIPVDYVAENDIMRGKLMVGQVLSPIPFAQFVYKNLFGVPTEQMSSALFITWLYHGSLNYRVSGLGSSLIGDLFLNFGWIGVVFFMGLLGYFIEYAYYRFKYEHDIYWSAIYLIMIGSTFTYVRGSYLAPLNDIFWSLLVLYFFKKK